MKKYSEKGWNWLIDHYPHEPGRYWFEGFNPVEGYPNKPDLTRKDIHVLADVDDITHPLDATAVTNLQVVKRSLKAQKRSRHFS